MKKKKILVTPLDWGLGHATRCIPVINELLKRDCEVMLASSGDAFILLQKEFPQLKIFKLPGYNPRYSALNGSMVLKIGAQLPKILKAIFKEHQAIEKIIHEEKINVVISDNRYGCYSKNVKSIFVTHQLNILMPDSWKWGERCLNHFNHRQIKNFDECWIPAPPDSFIPELLLSPSSIKKKYIGHLSRFKKTKDEKKYDVIAIISGPDPQRQILADKIQAQFKVSDLKTLLVRGSVSGTSQIRTNGNHAEVNHLLSNDLNEAINQSSIVVSRSGYSTVMDLVKLNKKAIFIPTPGQTEQEHLAVELMKNKIAFSMKQSEFDLEKALKESVSYKGFVNFEYAESLLSKAIDSVL